MKTKLKQVLGLLLVFALCITGSGVMSYQVASSVTSETDSADEDTNTVTTQAQSTSTDSGGSSISDIVDKVSDSVVEVSTEMKQVSPNATEYVTEGAGSGVILSEDGYIVTNHHVIDGATSITVRTSDGTEYEATLVASDEKTDIAVLKIEETGLTYATFGDSSQVRVGDEVIAIGNPLGELGGTVTEGIISALDREITIDGQTMTLLQFSASVSPGNSGGGLFDSEGNLIGIVNAKSSDTDAEGLGFAIPSNTVKEVVEELIENGYVTGRAQLGISVVETSDTQIMTQYKSNEKGVYITAVYEADGLQTGDRIVSVNGVEVTTSNDLQDIIDSCEVGDVVSVTVVRNGEQVDVNVTLTEYSQTSSEREEQVL
ncbi:MAG: S1C family serine protease [Lachnospiraceae bacterium]